MDGQWIEHDGIPEQHSYDSSSNSNNSSISSLSSNSSDSDYKMTAKAGDLEADADSLTCRQMENNSKHVRMNMHTSSTNFIAMLCLPSCISVYLYSNHFCKGTCTL